MQFFFPPSQQRVLKKKSRATFCNAHFAAQSLACKKIVAASPPNENDTQNVPGKLRLQAFAVRTHVLHAEARVAILNSWHRVRFPFCAVSAFLRPSRWEVSFLPERRCNEKVAPVLHCLCTNTYRLPSSLLTTADTWVAPATTLSWPRVEEAVAASLIPVVASVEATVPSAGEERTG